eukprot:gene6356-6848_t
MLKFVVLFVFTFFALSSASHDPILVHLEDAASCSMCRTALKPFLTNPVPTSLINSCDSYSSNSARFAACIMVWTSRYDHVSNLVQNGCQNSNGQIVKPCPVEAICNTLAAPGKALNLNNRYCEAPKGFNQFLAISPVMTMDTPNLRKREEPVIKDLVFE